MNKTILKTLLAVAILIAAGMLTTQAAKLRARIKAASPPIYVLSTNTATSYDLGTQTIWVQQIDVPGAGTWVLQETRDAGLTWWNANTFTASATNPWPLITITVNPAIPPPYVWYRLVQINYQPK